jgi:cell division protease FtsH
VPYNPTFLEQIRKDNVKEISSSGDTVKGEFKREVTHEDETAKRFETEFPTFADDATLSRAQIKTSVASAATTASGLGGKR